MNYAQRIAAIRTDKNLSDEQKRAFINQAAEQEYGSQAFNIGEFEQLLGRLEGSKIRQQRQKSVENRRDIFAGGLAGMMSNF